MLARDPGIGALIVICSLAPKFACKIKPAYCKEQ
jgi:hypothetical protein